MKAHHTEKFRLTVLQKQLINWLRNEGGGCLRADQLFTTMIKNHHNPETDSAILAERMYEAIENLCKKGFAEVRLEKKSTKKPPFSIYDFGNAGRNFTHVDSIYAWVGGDCPTVALTTEGLASR